MGSRCLLVMRVSGWSREPVPPARMTPFMGRSLDVKSHRYRAGPDPYPSCPPAGRPDRTERDRAGQARSDQGPKARSPNPAQTTPACGSNHTKAPLRPKCPYVQGELADPVQWGCLWPRISTPNPQSQGSKRWNPGRTPARPGNCTDVASRWVSKETRVGTAHSAPSATRSVRGPTSPAAAEPPAASGS